MASVMRSRRALVASVIVLLIVLAGAVTFLTRRSEPEQVASTTATAHVSTLSQTVSASGTIAPRIRSDLNFTSAGTVTSVAVKMGDTVAAGQTLASIDPTALQQAVDSAQAGVDAASATLSATRSSSTATSYQIAAASSQLNAANAKLETANAQRAAADLVTPIAGTVAVVDLSVGHQVSGSGSTSGTGSGGAAGSSGSSSSGSSASSSAAIVVIQTDAWVVEASVSSADLPQVKPDLQVQIVPTGSTTTVFGTVSSVGVIATTSSGVASFPVTVAVTGSPSGLFAGATAAVNIVVKEVADALVVPTGAITTADGKTVVTKVQDGQQVTTAVTIGMVQGTLTQIVTGLAEGDQVQVTRSAGPNVQGGSQPTRTRGSSGFPGGGAGQPPNGMPGGGQGAPPAGAGQ